jgi:serine/threonine protein kinase
MLEPNQTLLHYRIVDKLGEGGMGVVWRAVDTTLDRTVAIKSLPDNFATDPERLARFEREAKSLAALNHPHIAGIFGIHQAPSTHSTSSGIPSGSGQEAHHRPYTIVVVVKNHQDRPSN